MPMTIWGLSECSADEDDDLDGSDEDVGSLEDDDIGREDGRWVFVVGDVVPSCRSGVGCDGVAGLEVFVGWDGVAGLEVLTG